MIRAIAIDDEPHALDLIRLYAEKIDGLDLVLTTSDPWEAKKVLDSESFDLVFLDIQMPELSGLQLLDLTDQKVNVIITSAYSEYAIEGYRYAVADYLLKPFSFERFHEAVKRALMASEIRNGEAKGHYLMLKGDAKGSFRKIDVAELKFVEAMRNYAAFHLDSERILALMTLSEIEGKLPNRFQRIHRSFIVDLDKVERIEGNTLYIGDKDLPVGKTYRNDVFKSLGL